MVHAMAAMLLALWCAVCPAKRSRLHQFGYAWVASMVLVAVIGFFIHEIRVTGVFSPIHLLSLFVLVTLFTAVSAANMGVLVSTARPW